MSTYRQKPAQIMAYAWDLQDEGLEQCLDAIINTAGCNEICVVFSYHISTYFLPRNPVRKLYYGEHGAIYFQPDQELYRNTKIRPQVSAVVDGPDYLSGIVGAIEDRGLPCFAKIVYLYNHHLAAKYPDCAKTDVFGNHYLSQLCPANPDVRAYALALTQDVVVNFGPAGLVFESLSYLRFDYGFLNPKVFMEIAPRCRFLMGLCFCPHCCAIAKEAGMDIERFASQVQTFLIESLDRNPTELDRGPVNDGWLQAAFGGQLARFIDIRKGVVGSLFQSVVEVSRSKGPIVLQAGLSGDENVTCLVQELVVPLLDRLRITLPRASEGEQGDFVAGHRSWLPNDKRLMVFVAPPNAKSREEVVGGIRAAGEAGADGFCFLYYGLLNRDYLESIGAARSYWV